MAKKTELKDRASALYFMRHAEAGEHDSKRWPDDSQRPLTPEGLKQARKAAAGLRRSGLRLTRVYSSPYVRARQTAEAAAEELKFKEKIAFTPALEPGGDFGELEALLRKTDHETVLLVGHEPSIGHFVSCLLGEDDGLPIEFEKAAVCRLDVVSRSPLKATLRWFLPPRLAKQLRKK